MCFAQKPAKNANPMMNFKNFCRDPPYALTCLDHNTYMATHVPSPWSCVRGWTLTNCMFDFMRNCFLGSARVFIASSLRLLLEHGCFDSYNVDRESSAMFAFITMEIHKAFRDAEFRDQSPRVFLFSKALTLVDLSAPCAPLPRSIVHLSTHL